MSGTAPPELQPLSALATAWHDLLQALPDPAWVVELPSCRLQAVNETAVALLALPRDQLLALRADQLLCTPEDQAYWAEAVAGAEDTLLSDTVLATVGDLALPVRRSVRPLHSADGRRRRLVSLQDLSAVRRTEDRLEDALAELRATLESTADGILVTDLGGRVRAFNRRLAAIWGLPPELLQAQQDDAVHEWMRRMARDPLSYQRRLQTLNESVLFSATERIELVTGQVLERVAQPLWSRGRPLGRVYAFRDLSERLQADQRIETLARTDSLTGLPNRRQMADSLDQAAMAMRHDGDGFALMVIDLDRFRRINDSLGHERGDEVLRDAADRIRRCMRQGDEVARTNGDQFALLVRHADAGAAEAAAARVLAAMSQPWQFEGVPFTVTCSIGIALCPGQGRNADDLLRHAEEAMRRAKDAGSNSLRFHQHQASSNLRSRMQLDHSMRQALASGRFRLHYQPQVELRTGRIVGAEALLRWRDPALGDVPPGQFIPVAEESGFIIAIGDWVLGQAARQAAQWAKAGHQVPVAVNVSALQFLQPQFVDRVADVLREHGLPAERLELELTESILVRDADDALERLEALHRLGVKLSIDDFGTGYSSLAYLKRFPIGKLKIDRSFVQGLPADESDAGIVRAIVQMARALGMQVIAEGVETEPQRQFLLEAGCRHYQGYLFAPAMDALSFAKRLRLGPAPASGRSAVVHRLARS